MLAIIIPYYKISFFEATLQSLANQTDKRFNVYIGDDASPQLPGDLLDKFKNQFKFLYHRFESNLGSKSLVKQWERCMALANDEPWLMILGDDDVLEVNVVATFYENLELIENEQSSVIRFSSQVIDAEGVVVSKIYKHPNKELAVDFLIRKSKGGTRSSLSEYIFKSEKVKKNRFKDFPLAWFSDVLGVIEFADNIIYTINEAIVYVRNSGENISSQKDSIEKNTAQFMFYYYLLLNYGKQYPKDLIQTLFEKLEKVQLNHKKTPLRWFKLFWLYVRFSEYPRFYSLINKIKKSIK